jgi:glycosyltransferase involved in cell wall biosynthesis
MTVHFIYKSGTPVSTPHAIGREVFKRLSRDFPAVLHDPASSGTINPAPGDILLGHPSFDRNDLFHRSVRKGGWAKTVVIHPFCPTDLNSYAHLGFAVPLCDAFLAITGRVWIDRLPETVFGQWAGELVHLDLAVDRADFPPLRSTEVAPAGTRRFLFVGNHPHYKNVPFLNKLAAQMPDVEFHRVGPFKRRFRHLKQHGPMDFGQKDALEFAASFDFMITPSEMDANPTTILEAMALGVLPVAPEGSGYYAHDGVLQISGRDLRSAEATIRLLQNLDSAEILERRRANWQRLDDHYNWDRFYEVVRETILSDNKKNFSLPPMARARLAAHYITSPRSPYGTKRIKARLSGLLGRGKQKRRG